MGASGIRNIAQTLKNMCAQYGHPDWSANEFIDALSDVADKLYAIADDLPSERGTSDADTSWVNALHAAATICAEIADRYPGQHAREVVLECVKAINRKANAAQAPAVTGSTGATLDGTPAAAPTISSDKDYLSLVKTLRDPISTGRAMPLDMAADAIEELLREVAARTLELAALRKVNAALSAPSATAPKLLRVTVRDFIKMAGKNPSLVGIPVYYAVWPNSEAQGLSRDELAQAQNPSSYVGEKK